MEQPITIVSRLTVNPGMEELLREELLRIVDLSRREIGCIYYDMYRSLEDEGEFVIFETWNGPDALHTHAYSPHAIRLRALPGGWLKEPVRQTQLTLIV